MTVESLPGTQECHLPIAIRRDPEACEKLEATMLRLRRDQKGSGQAVGGGLLDRGRAGWNGWQAECDCPDTHRGSAALLCHMEHQLPALS